MEKNKTQTFLMVAILVVLIGILVALIIVTFMLKNTLGSLENTIRETESAMTSVHKIYDTLASELQGLDSAKSVVKNLMNLFIN